MAAAEINENDRNEDLEEEDSEEMSEEVVSDEDLKKALRLMEMKLEIEFNEFIMFMQYSKTYDEKNQKLMEALDKSSIPVKKLFHGALKNAHPVDGIPYEKLDTVGLQVLSIFIMVERSKILKRRIAHTRTLLSFKEKDQRPWESDRPQIAVVDDGAGGFYSDVPKSSFLQRYVRLRFDLNSPRSDRRYEWLWVQVKSLWQQKDSDDELYGVIVSSPIHDGGNAKGEEVSFTRQEITDVYDVSGSLECFRVLSDEDEVKQLATWYRQNNQEKSEEQLREIWSLLSHRERRHIQWFANYIKDINERDRKLRAAAED